MRPAPAGDRWPGSSPWIGSSAACAESVRPSIAGSDSSEAATQGSGVSRHDGSIDRFKRVTTGFARRIAAGDQAASQLVLRAAVDAKTPYLPGMEAVLLILGRTQEPVRIPTRVAHQVVYCLQRWHN